MNNRQNMPMIVLLCSLALLCFPVHGNSPLGHESIGVINETDEEIFEMLKTKLKGAGFEIQRTIRRLGKKTLELQAYSVVDARLDLMIDITKDYKSYGRWVLPGINNKPNGGQYFAKFISMASTPSDHSLLKIFLKLDFPLYKRNLLAHLKMTTTKTKRGFQLTGILKPKDVNKAVIPRVELVLKVFQSPTNPEQVWTYTKGWMVVRPWLLYQALPEKRLRREAGERVQILIDNYMGEELRSEKIQKDRKISQAANTAVK